MQEKGSEEVMGVNMFDNNQFDQYPGNYQQGGYYQQQSYNNNQYNSYIQPQQYDDLYKAYNGNTYDVSYEEEDNEDLNEDEEISFSFKDYLIAMVLFVIPVIGFIISCIFLGDKYAPDEKRNLGKAGMVVNVLLTVAIGFAGYFVLIPALNKDAVTQQVTYINQSSDAKDKIKSVEAGDDAKTATEISFAGKKINDYSAAEFVEKYSLNVISASDGDNITYNNWREDVFPEGENLITYFLCNDSSGNTYTIGTLGNGGEVMSDCRIVSLNVKNAAGNIGLEMSSVVCASGTINQFSTAFGANRSINPNSYLTEFAQSDGTLWGIKINFDASTNFPSDISILQK